MMFNLAHELHWTYDGMMNMPYEKLLIFHALLEDYGERMEAEMRKATRK